jgi:nicotinate-nucleotide adenylyltransferase
MTQKVNGIGLFGGTFDPIHIGHLIIAEWLSEILDIETTYFIPTKIHPFQKRTNITDAKLRLEMLKIALKDYPYFKINDFELSRDNISFTIDTIKYFHEKYPDKELYYFLGSDNLASFLEWKDPFEILEICYLAVYQREKHSKPVELLNHPKVLNMTSPLINISSSHVRKRVSKKMAFKSLLPAGIDEFISKHKLYLT